MNNVDKKNNTRHQILKYIQDSNMVNPTEIGTHFDISRQMVHRHLKSLVEADKIKK